MGRSDEKYKDGVGELKPLDDQLQAIGEEECYLGSGERCNVLKERRVPIINKKRREKSQRPENELDLSGEFAFPKMRKLCLGADKDVNNVLCGRF